MRFLIRLLISAAALWCAVRLVPGLHYGGSPMGLVGIAVVFGVLNAIVRPILFLLSLPLLVLTLGLFTFVLNGVVLWLTSAFSHALGLQFTIDGFWAAFLGALVVSVVSTALSFFVSEHSERSRSAPSA